MSVYDKRIREIRWWHTLLAKAGLARGLRPYPVRYELVTDAQMLALIPYTMLPARYRYWSFGKQFEQWKEQMKNSHIFEAVINSNESFCYLGLTNEMPMQVLVIGHAVWGHIDYFANNYMFAESGADTIIKRLAMHAEVVKKLSQDPNYGVERVEYILDAAHAISDYCGSIPTPKDLVSDEEARAQLLEEINKLRSRRAEALTDFEVESIDKQLKVLEQASKRSPINPTDDLLGFLFSEKNPRLRKEERQLCSIVWEEARYLLPQGPNKIMNEGWASFWEKELLLCEEVSIPDNWRMEFPAHWSMHNRQPADRYFNPYALGLRIFKDLDQKHGYIEDFETEVEIPDRIITDTMPENRDRFEGVYQLLDGRYISYPGTFTKKKIRLRNYDFIRKVRANYKDSSAIRTFLTDEMIEEINRESMEWTIRMMGIISNRLKQHGWAEQLVPTKLPTESLEAMMGVVEVWANAADAAEQAQAALGTPPFPVPLEYLQQMAEMIQLVAAFDADKKTFRQMMVRRTAGMTRPQLYVEDDGSYSDGTLTVRHVYDEALGTLLRAEAIDVLKYVKRLWGGANKVRLLTKFQDYGDDGKPVGAPYDYEYIVDERGEVKEISSKKSNMDFMG
jgi:spore cortex formation protein SpoVR/YcgB (stage V sporulation)